MMRPLHPLCTLFPRIEGKEFDALVADIAANGLREPIIVSDGMVLDGGNRQRACDIAGVEPRYQEFMGDSIAAYVISKNLHRRHLTEGQRAAIVASTTNWAKAFAQGDAKIQTGNVAGFTVATGNVAGRGELSTQKGRADEANVSIRTQRMADLLAKKAPDKLAEVRAGTKSLPEAVRELTPRRQQATIADEAFGDTTPQSLIDDQQADIVRLNAKLVEAQATIAALEAQVSALERDDTKAQLGLQVRLNQVTESRLAQETNKVHKLQADLDSYGRFYADLRKLTNVESKAGIVAAVKYMAQQQEDAL